MEEAIEIRLAYLYLMKDEADRPSGSASTGPARRQARVARPFKQVGAWRRVAVEVGPMTTTTTHPRPAAPPRLRAPDRAWVIRGIAAGLALLQAPFAFLGGIEMLRHPLDALGMPLSMIQGSPFDTFTWPGILLLVLNGVVPSALAIGVLCRVRGALPLLGAWGVGMMGWITAQLVVSPERLWLQPAMFALGATVAIVALIGWRRNIR